MTKPPPFRHDGPWGLSRAPHEHTSTRRHSPSQLQTMSSNLVLAVSWAADQQQLCAQICISWETRGTSPDGDKLV